MPERSSDAQRQAARQSLLSGARTRADALDRLAATARRSTRSCARPPTRRARASRCSGSTRGTQGAAAPTSHSDSTAAGEIGDLQFDVALEAARTRQVGARRPRPATSGRVGRGRAARCGYDARARKRPRRRLRGRLLARRWRTSTPTVSLIRQRVLVAGAGSRCSARCSPATCWSRARLAARAAAGGRRRAASPQGDFAARFPVGRPRRARPARPHAGRDAAPARRARRRAQALHRHRLARAAHADLLARRLPRAARGRGARRGDARGASCTSCASRSTALRKLATELLDLSHAGGRVAGAAPRARPTSATSRRTVAAEFAPALAAHDVAPGAAAAGGPVEAMCDPERVAQIMRILIDNALIHTPPGTDVVVAASRRNGRARLAVTDFGTGYPRGRCCQRDLRAVLHLRRRPGLRASAWRSPTSWPSAWTASSPSTACRGARPSRWSCPL